ncbi:MAG: hydrolase [Candidatus Magnetoovum sp. WYHC-5]|nr:hydrolase [Candidatus Magnetoovum sp. WYHC-5]
MIGRYELNEEDCILIILDIQEKLAAAVLDKESVIENALHLIELCKLHNIPIIVTEQYPKGIGHTVAELAQSLAQSPAQSIEGFNSVNIVEKLTFSCCGAPSFAEQLKVIDRKKVIICGIEAHICVLQTTIDLLKNGYTVHIVKDGVSSRMRENKEVALNYMQQAGAIITTTETVLFQILKKAGTDKFKIISKRVK